MKMFSSLAIRLIFIRGQKKLFTKDHAPRWILDIDYWILDIEKKQKST